MNKRITKIVIDTLGKEGVVNSRAFGHWALSDEELEKFAELIVQDLIDSMIKRYGDDDELPIQEIEFFVKEHFGVDK